MKDMFEIADLIANDYKKDPRNKTYATEELILASILEETGELILAASLHGLIDQYQSGELSSIDEEKYDAASYGCGVLARKCFAEDPKAVFETTPPNWNTPNTNSVYWLAGRSINPSVFVNANTSILDLKFLVSYGSVVWYSGDADTGGDGAGNWHTDCDDTTPCVGRIRIGGFDMNVSAE